MGQTTFCKEGRSLVTQLWQDSWKVFCETLMLTEIWPNSSLSHHTIGCQPILLWGLVTWQITSTITNRKPVFICCRSHTHLLRPLPCLQN